MSRTLRPDAACPRCGRRAAIDIPEEERLLALEQPPGALKQNVNCWKCGFRYPIRADAYHRAA